MVPKWSPRSPAGLTSRLADLRVKLGAERGNVAPRKAVHAGAADRTCATGCAASARESNSGELFVASGVAHELMGIAPRRTLNLRGHEQPIDTFVLAA